MIWLQKMRNVASGPLNMYIEGQLTGTQEEFQFVLICLTKWSSGRRRLTMLLRLPNNVGFSLYVDPRGCFPHQLFAYSSGLTPGV